MFDLADITLFLGLAIITAVMLRLTYRRLGRRSKDQPLLEKVPRQTPCEYSKGEVPPEEITRLEAELCDLARETSARLDSKMAALAELIRQADIAAERLEEANREAAKRENNNP